MIQAYTDADVRMVAFNSDGSLLATAGTLPGDSVAQSADQNAGITIWRTATGGRLAALSTGSTEALTGLSFRADDTQLIATGSANWWTWGVF